MSVTEVRLHSAGASGTASGTDKGGQSISYRCAYRVYVDSPLDSPTTILKFFETNSSSGSVPLPYVSRPFKFGNGFDGLAICNNLQVDYVENSAGQYHVSASFAWPNEEEEKNKNPYEDEKGKPTKDPLKQRDEIDVSYSQISVPVESAIFQRFINAKKVHPAFQQGKRMALQSSNCQPFDPTIETEVDVVVVRVTKIKPQYTGHILQPYNGAINVGTFSIDKSAYAGFRQACKAYQCKFRVVGNGFGQETVGNKLVKFFRQTCEFQFINFDDGWRRVLLDRGLAELWKAEDIHPTLGTLSNADFSSTRPYFSEPPKDLDGYPVTAPFNLDGDGHRLKPDDNPVFGVWSVAPEISFAALKGLAW